MKRFLIIIPFIALTGCAQVKNNTASIAVEHQLLKDIETLSSDKFEGRKTGTKGAQIARKYLITRFKEIGLQPYPPSAVYEQVFKLNEKDDKEPVLGKNLIGYIPGKTDNVIVISAHYDHLGMIKQEVYNGADDNASGVSALLQIANYFMKNKPNNTLVFALFDAEEIGLLGSGFFVNNPVVALEKIKLNINMDMISRSDKQELYVCGTFKYPELKGFLSISNPRIKLLIGHDDPKLGHNDWTNQSDQASFNAKNIPFLYFGVEDHKDYHQVTDEFKNLDKVFFIDAANAIQEVILNIDNQRDLKTIFKEKKQMEKQ